MSDNSATVPLVMRFAYRAEEPDVEDIFGEYDEDQQRCPENRFSTGSSPSGATGTVGGDRDTEYP